MRYEDYRGRIKSGDLLAFTHRGWNSWYDIKVQIVRMAQRSEYSHVGIALVLGGRVWVVESVIPLVRMVPLSNFMPCYISRVPGMEWRDKDTEFALSFVGNDEYSYSQREAVRAFYGQNDESNKLLECAEFVRIVYEHAGVDLQCKATPSDVVLAVQRLGGTLNYLETP